MRFFDGLVDALRELPEHFRSNVPPFFRYALIGAVVVIIIGLIGNLLFL